MRNLILQTCLAIGLATSPALATSAEDALKATISFRSANELAILNDFKDLLSMPNVSKNAEDMKINAAWITDYIGRRGFESQVLYAGRAPYIYAERKFEGASKTILIYAHFDGQPVEPKNWVSPPFTPTLRTSTVEDGGSELPWPNAGENIDPSWRLFARSAGDDKAPIIALMAAIDAMEQAGITPSVNIKLILDGEEEFGSPTLKGILDAHSDLLKSDLLLFCDGPMHQSRKRQLVFGVRGTMGMDLTMYGPSKPLHSGHYGNWSPNPSEKLVKLLNGMIDYNSVGMTFPGFNDDVKVMTKAERNAISNMPNMEESLKKALSISNPIGNGARLEEQIMKPAIILNGFQAGGVKGQARNIILPSATATLNLRLVASQRPKNVYKAFISYLEGRGYTVMDREPTAEEKHANDNIVTLETDMGYPAFKTDLSDPTAQKLIKILNEIDGKDTLLTPTMGGSLPIYLFEQALDAPIIILPIANHDNNQHGRNENLRIQNLWDAIDIYGAVITRFK